MNVSLPIKSAYHGSMLFFVEHGTQEELYRECGFDAEGIFKTIQELNCKSLISNNQIFKNNICN